MPLPDETTELEAVSICGDAAAVIDAATRAVTPHPLDAGQVYLVVGADGEATQVDTEGMLDGPHRATGKLEVYTPASFIHYVNSQVHDGAVITSQWDQGRVVGVLNWHNAEGTGWGDHRVTLALRETPEWKHWIGGNNTAMGQVAFAEHLEDGAAEIVDPPSADMLELAKTFEAKKSVDFKEQIVLESNARGLVYNETVQAKAGQTGQIEVPREFTIGVAPFEGVDPYKVVCRLRYSIDNGHLSIGYVMHRPHLVLREAVHHIVVAVEEATGIAAYEGTPPTR
jgi:uncharacterized protein YfdQ (DUF2303 family)